MTPEMQRVFRLNPRLRKALRERQAELLAAVDGGEAKAVLEAAAAWAEAEKAAASDVAAKTAEPPRHRVGFLLEETYYKDCCETAIENDLSPGEVARRYCISGHTFSSLIWGAVRAGSSMVDVMKVRPGELNIAQIALPNFSGKNPIGLF
jgi:hypothetical protein